VNDTYFADASRRLDALASPLFDRQLALAVPPALIMTGEYDTLAPEMDRLAQALSAAGVPVVHRQFAKTDHGFTHAPPLETAREAIRLTGAHLAAAYTR
jgi:acetyl esterase/lipase